MKANIENPEGIEIPIPVSEAHLETASTHFLVVIKNQELPLQPFCDAENSLNAQ